MSGGLMGWPTDQPCDDCGSTERVRHYPDPECHGVHACNLCAACATPKSEAHSHLDQASGDTL